MKKRLLLMASMVGLLLVVSASSVTGMCGPTIRLRIYDQNNYGAPSALRCYNEPNYSNISYGGLPWENMDNNVSSVKVTVATQFYNGFNYTSLLTVYSAGSNVPYVGNALNDKFSSSWNGYNPQ